MRIAAQHNAVGSNVGSELRCDGDAFALASFATTASGGVVVQRGDQRIRGDLGHDDQWIESGLTQDTQAPR